MKKHMIITLFLVHLTHTPALLATDWYVSPQGKEQNKGTRESPWNLGPAIGGGLKVKPGDTLYLLAGTYRQRPRENFEVRLKGTEKEPIVVRPAPGEHAIIDGGLAVLEPSEYLWIRDLEIFVSEPDTTRTKPSGPGSWPADFTRPSGGLNVHAGKQCKFINLYIHDCRQGVNLWHEATDSELYGCIVNDNGWTGTDRGHGHAIYTQNKDGVCTIADCLMTGGRAYSLHAYGSSKAYVDNYHIEGNIVFDAGAFLIGGGRPSRDIHVSGNYLYNVDMQLGYSAPHNVNCEVRDNVILNGGLRINRYQQVINEGNLVLSRNDKRPADPLVVLRPNKYDENLAHLAIYNWDKRPKVSVDLSRILQAGDNYRLMDPREPFGKAVHQGRYEGRPVELPMMSEFAAFVVVKDGKR